MWAFAYCTLSYCAHTENPVVLKCFIILTSWFLNLQFCALGKSNRLKHSQTRHLSHAIKWAGIAIYDITFFAVQNEDLRTHSISYWTGSRLSIWERYYCKKKRICNICFRNIYFLVQVQMYGKDWLVFSLLITEIYAPISWIHVVL